MKPRWTTRETIFAIWCLAALAALPAAVLLLDAAWPVFTVVWIVPPLATVAATRDASRAGFRTIAVREFLIATGITLAGLCALTALMEPWSQAYRSLLHIAIAQPAPDTTFAWLVRLPRLPGLAGMLIYSSLATLFAEELFFRGWLLQAAKRRWGIAAAVVLQAALFTLPNVPAALVLPPPAGAVYALGYAFTGIGLIGGWAAARTGSIWPSLVSATILNFVLTVLLT